MLEEEQTYLNRTGSNYQTPPNTHVVEQRGAEQIDALVVEVQPRIFALRTQQVVDRVQARR